MRVLRVLLLPQGVGGRGQGVDAAANAAAAVLVTRGAMEMFQCFMPYS